MRKHITPHRIIHNGVDYSFEDFLKGLWKDVDASLSQEEFSHISNRNERNKEVRKNVKEVFNFVCEICFQAALKNPRLTKILDTVNEEEKNIIKKTIKSYKDHIDLLRAIFVREIASEIEKGLTRRQATRLVIEQEKNILIQYMRSQATQTKK